MSWGHQRACYIESQIYTSELPHQVSSPLTFDADSGTEDLDEFSSDRDIDYKLGSPLQVQMLHSSQSALANGK